MRKTPPLRGTARSPESAAAAPRGLHLIGHNRPPRTGPSLRREGGRTSPPGAALPDTKESAVKIRAGRVFWKEGQRYEVIGPTDHIMKDGRVSSLAIVESHCVDCGRPFRFKASARMIAARQVNRRCDAHKRPGTPVVPRAGRSLSGAPAASPAPRAEPAKASKPAEPRKAGAAKAPAGHGGGRLQASIVRAATGRSVGSTPPPAPTEGSQAIKTVANRSQAAQDALSTLRATSAPPRPSYLD